MTRTEQPVVVGVDGSASSAQAALWAATEAMRLSVPLRVILVNDDPAREAHAAAVVRDIRTSCQRAERELEITDEVSFGHPAEKLLRHADSARMIVVGSRGQGAFQEALLGSTSAAVATHASCPVVIVPAIETPASSEVIVGVDGSTDSRTALHFAFESASQNGNELVAVQALPTAQFIPGPYDHPDRDELLALAEQDLSTQVSAWTGDFPNVAVRQVVSNLPPVRALRDAAQHARLLVVGHRGIGGFPGLLLGSVARGVLHHAPCPVAVIPS